MPTVILLDVSLSMSRPAGLSEGADEYQLKHLAVHGINTLLDHCTTHTKLEFVSLVIFLFCEIPFTLSDKLSCKGFHYQYVWSSDARR